MPPAMQTDQGWAWVVLVASMGSMFLNGVLAYSVGVMHAGLLRKFNESVSLTAWVGGLYTSLIVLAAPLSSILIGRFGCRTCALIGGVMLLTGLSSSALVTSIGQLFLTYGLIAGTGLALTFAPSLITVGFYFEKFRGLASGISSAAAGVGILLGSVIMQFLIDEFSLEGAFLLAGAMAFHHCLFAMFYRPTVHERKTLSSSFKEKSAIERSTLSLHSVEIIIKDSVSPLTEKCIEEDFNALAAQVLLLQENSTKNQTSDERHVGNESMLDASDVVCGQIPTLDEQDQRTTVAENIKTTPSKEDSTVNIPLVTKSVGSDEQSRPSSSIQSLKGAKDIQRNQVSLPPTEDDSLGTGAMGHQLHYVNGYNTDSPANRRKCDKYCRELMQVIGNTAFMCFSLAQLTTMVSMMGVYLHLPEYVHTLGTSPPAAASLFMPLGLMSLVSRLLSGVTTIDRRIDPLTITMGMTGLCGLATALFPLYAETYAGQMTYSSLFGLYTGGLNALYNVLIVKFVGVSLLNTAFGVLGVCMGVGVIAGPPVAALIVDLGGTYEHSFIFLGCTMELSVFLNLLAGSCLASSEE